ncbi:MAG TPA: hypothetical protein VL971_01500 [Rhizomicrobium sp.]|jgi:hypothetical protein|nr:hypothetical protein [Rhizomicrobium sp.]
MAGRRKQNGKIDEEIEETFPASDPPAFMPGALGAPKRRKSTGKPRKKAASTAKSQPKKAKKKKPATKRRKAR